MVFSRVTLGPAYKDSPFGVGFMLGHFLHALNPDVHGILFDEVLRHRIVRHDVNV